MAEYDVFVYIYEVSGGLARSLSPLILGKQINGIWHTGIVVYGHEYFYGGEGITYCRPGGTVLGQPQEKLLLGKTQIPKEMFMEYITDLAQTTFSPECYHLFDHNCNTFSNEAAQFLTGQHIPAEITGLPQDVMDTPFGAMIKQFLDALSVRAESGQSLSSMGGSTPGTLPNRQNKSLANHAPASKTAANHKPGPAASSKAAVDTPNLSDQSEPLKPSVLQSLPSYIYTDKMVLETYISRRDYIRGNLQPEDAQRVDDLFEYVSLPECTWSLGPLHIRTLSRLILDSTIPLEVDVVLAGLIELALSCDDTVNACVHDAEQSLIKVIESFDTINSNLCLIVAKWVCNCVANPNGIAWFLAKAYHTTPVLLFVKLCTHLLLLGDAPMRTVTGHITGNTFKLATAMSAEVSLEIGIALIETCNRDKSHLPDDYLLYSLGRCMEINPEVAAVAKAMELDLSEHEPNSETSSTYLDFIKKQLSTD